MEYVGGEVVDAVEGLLEGGVGFGVGVEEGLVGGGGVGVLGGDGGMVGLEGGELGGEGLFCFG